MLGQGLVCCFTGHRKIDGNTMRSLSLLLDRALERLIADGVTVFRTGGAMGFDTLVSLKILELKKRGEDIILELYVPCRTQADRWSDCNREYYGYILENADRVIYVSDDYFKGCMHERNRRMVEGSQFCVGFCMTESGGSAYTIDYAKSKNLRVINLAAML